MHNGCLKATFSINCKINFQWGDTNSTKYFPKYTNEKNEQSMYVFT